MTLAKTLSEHGSFQYVVVSVRNTATTEELPSRLRVIRFPGTHKNRRCLGHPTVLSWGKKVSGFILTVKHERPGHIHDVLAFEKLRDEHLCLTECLKYIKQAE